jgi:hypothetical protein
MVVVVMMMVMVGMAGVMRLRRDGGQGDGGGQRQGGDDFLQHGVSPYARIARAGCGSPIFWAVIAPDAPACDSVAVNAPAREVQPTVAGRRRRDDFLRFLVFRA